MPVNNYDHIFTKGPESALPGIFEDGKIRFTVDTGRLFVDGQNARTEVSDFVKGMTEQEIKSQLAPLANKIYISSDTNKFMIYDSSVADNWINIANSGQADHADDADEATHASTADYATNSGTATHASTADYATNAGTSTYATNAGTAVHASTADFATNAGSATFATNSSTAAYANNSGTVNGKTVAENVPSGAKFTDTTYAAGTGIALNSGTFSNSGVRAIAEGGANGTINVNTNGSTANIAVHGLGALAYKDSLSKSDVGLSNVANLDQSKAIKSITRSGTTFTATAIDGSTSSFTQQDNDTTYTGANGIALSGTTFSNSGVRAIATGTANGTINVNTNGSTADVAIKGLGSNAYSSTSYLPLAGGTMTGQIILSSKGFRTSSNNGYRLDSNGNFVYLGNSASNYFCIVDSNDVQAARLYYLSGNTSVRGSMKIGGHADDTAGCTLQYNANTQSLDFIFA